MCCHLSHYLLLAKRPCYPTTQKWRIWALGWGSGPTTRSWKLADAFTYFTRISEPNAVWENLNFFVLYKNILWKTSQEKSGDASTAPECITPESGSFCSSSVVIDCRVYSSPSSLSCPCRSKILKQGLKYLGKWLKCDRKGSETHS